MKSCSKISWTDSRQKSKGNNNFKEKQNSNSKLLIKSWDKSDKCKFKSTIGWKLINSILKRQKKDQWRKGGRKSFINKKSYFPILKNIVINLWKRSKWINMKVNCLKNSWIFHQDSKCLQKINQTSLKIKINKVCKCKQKAKKF